MPHLCGVCSKEFRILAEYNRHRKHHERPFQCKDCSQAFGSRSNLIRHEQSKHPSQFTNAQNIPFTCHWPGCSTETTRKDYLQTHMRRKHTRLSVATLQQAFDENKKIEEFYNESVHEHNALVANEISDTELFEVIARGNEAIFHSIIVRGFDPKIKTSSNKTLLYIAAKAGHASMFNALLSHTSDANTLQTTLVDLAREETVHEVFLKPLLDICIKLMPQQLGLFLIIASRGGYVEIAEFLLRHGAGVNHNDTNLKTPLATASKNGHEKVVRLLLDHQADVNHESIPLWYACSHGSIEAVKILLENGAYVNQSYHGYMRKETPLCIASKKGHEAVVKLLLGYQADVNEDNPLYYACSHGSIEIVKILHKNGADVNQSTYWDGTPLCGASEKGHEAVVRLLLSHQADVTKNSPLYYACFHGSIEIIKILLENGADVNQSIDWDRTPLYAASVGGHEAVVRLLLSHQADVNKGKPLYYACSHGSIEIVKILLENGADVNYSPDRSETPLCIASANGREDLVNVLLRYKPDINKGNPLYHACSRGKTAIAKVLIEFGADVNLPDKEIRRSIRFCLHEAIRKVNTELVQVLLEAGAETHQKEFGGKTPLQIARKKNLELIINILLKHGAVE